MSDTTARAETPEVIRVVPELRGAHIERHITGTPATLLYFEAKYDLAGTPLPHGIVRVGLLSALRRLTTTRSTRLEVPEPLWLRFWPRTVALMLTFRLAGLVRRRRHEIGAYAMENNRVETLVGGRRRAPRLLVHAVAALVGAVSAALLDRLCFASPAARTTYATLPFVRHLPCTVVLELPRASMDDVPRPQPEHVVFVGVLECRKGVRELMAAWPAVHRAMPAARLSLVGPGPLADEVAAWCRADPSHRTYLGRLAHAEAKRAMSTATVVVAPSVPEGRWVEQIGLPIKEGLAAGATIVTTHQTGLTDWLTLTGHHVVDTEPRADLPRRLADALVCALRHPLDREAVRAALPPVDGRLASDAWLNAVDHTRPTPTHHA